MMAHWILFQQLERTSLEDANEGGKEKCQRPCAVGPDSIVRILDLVTCIEGRRWGNSHILLIGHSSFTIIGLATFCSASWSMTNEWSATQFACYIRTSQQNRIYYNLLFQFSWFLFSGDQLKKENEIGLEVQRIVVFQWKITTLAKLLSPYPRNGLYNTRPVTSPQPLTSCIKKNKLEVISHRQLLKARATTTKHSKKGFAHRGGFLTIHGPAVFFQQKKHSPQPTRPLSIWKTSMKIYCQEGGTAQVKTSNCYGDETSASWNRPSSSPKIPLRQILQMPPSVSLRSKT